MMEQKESSVLFSLKGLMSLEENRIRAEQEAQQRRAREEAELRAETERQLRAAEELRLRDEERRRREQEQRKAEEAARLAAIREAEVESAKAEVEQHARLEALAAKQSHEAMLVALKSDRSKARLKLALGVGSVLVLAAAGAALSTWRGAERERLARERAFAAEQQRAAADVARLAGAIESAHQKGEALGRDLASAQEILRRKREVARDHATKEPESMRGQGTRPPPIGRPRPKPETKKVCQCQPNDPICGCL